MTFFNSVKLFEKMLRSQQINRSDKFLIKQVKLKFNNKKLRMFFYGRLSVQTVQSAYLRSAIEVIIIFFVI